MRSVSVLLSDIPAGFKAVRVGTGSDGTFKLVPVEPLVLKSQLDDLERRYRLFLAWAVNTFQVVPPGLEGEVEAALGVTSPVS